MNQSSHKSVYEQVRRAIDDETYNCIYKQVCGNIDAGTYNRTYDAAASDVNSLLWQKIKARTAVFTFEYRWHVITTEMTRRDLLAAK